jgi:tripartite-type tricarboxylate transporter receptor subunit TctC
MMEYMPGANIVINNVTAGGGIAGATAIAMSRPDGYSLGAIVPWQLTDQFVTAGIPYNEKNFYPLGFGAHDGNFLIARTGLGFKTVQDFVDYAHANPGALTFGVGGAMNVHDFFRMRIQSATGVDVVRMPFDGGAPTLAATIAGNVDVASVSISEALGAIADGTVVPLAVSQTERTPLAPDIPTMIEVGFPGASEAQWRLITCPPETPQEIKDKIVDVLAKVFADPRWLEETMKAGYNPMNITGPEAIRYFNEQFEAYKGILEEMGLI